VDRKQVIERAEQAILTKDWETYSALLAPDVRWFTPLFEAPIVGRETMLAMQTIVFEDVFDSFRYPDIGYGEHYVYMHFIGTVGDVVLHGTDRVVVNDEGFLSEFHVDGRTLAAMQSFGTAVQNAFAARGIG
jgi:hypothetical protein